MHKCSELPLPHRRAHLDSAFMLAEFSPPRTLMVDQSTLGIKKTSSLKDSSIHACALGYSCAYPEDALPLALLRLLQSYGLVKSL